MPGREPGREPCRDDAALEPGREPPLLDVAVAAREPGRELNSLEPIDPLVPGREPAVEGLTGLNQSGYWTSCCGRCSRMLPDSANSPMSECSEEREGEGVVGDGTHPLASRPPRAMFALSLAPESLRPPPLNTFPPP